MRLKISKGFLRKLFGVASPILLATVSFLEVFSVWFVIQTFLGLALGAFAFLLDIQISSENEVNEKSAVKLARDKRIQQLNDLVPVFESLASSTMMLNKQDSRHRLQKSLDALLSASVDLFDQESIRVSIYKVVRVQNTKPRLQVFDYKGRGKNPPRDFVSGDMWRGDHGLALALSKGNIHVPDSASDSLPPGVDKSDRYSSFISASIFTGEMVHGLISVDCQKPHRLEASDLDIVLVLAEAVALIFSLGIKMDLEDFKQNTKFGK